MIPNKKFEGLFAPRDPINPIEIPNDSLVFMIGVSGSGKSTFCKKYFKDHEVVCPDEYRLKLTNDMSNQDWNASAFEICNIICDTRMRLGLLTAIDATNTSISGQKSFYNSAASWARPTVAIVHDIPLEIAIERNNSRSRKVPEFIIKAQYEKLQTFLKEIDLKARFDYVFKVPYKPPTIQSNRNYVYDDNLPDDYEVN
jgi:protein phosphatase